jgi:hypothetical protein
MFFNNVRYLINKQSKYKWTSCSRHRRQLARCSRKVIETVPADHEASPSDDQASFVNWAVMEVDRPVAVERLTELS